MKFRYTYLLSAFFMMGLFPNQSHAAINENVYLWCEEYVVGEFKFTSDEAILCKSYFIGVRDLADALCKSMQ